MENRAEALLWWRGLAEEEKTKLAKDAFPLLPFEAVTRSSMLIEKLFHWLKDMPE